MISLNFMTVVSLVFVAAPALAAPGFFSCTTKTGINISAQIDGELNIGNFQRVNITEGTKAELEAYSISVSRKAFSLRAFETIGQEERAGYQIEAEKQKSGFYVGSLRQFTGEAQGPKEELICAIQFESSN